MPRTFFLWIALAATVACTEKTADEPEKLRACLESPDPVAPPTGQLPCELIPPGLELKR